MNSIKASAKTFYYLSFKYKGSQNETQDSTKTTLSLSDISSLIYVFDSAESSALKSAFNLLGSTRVR